MSKQGTLSPAEYAKATSLQSLLSKAVNDCYLTQSPCPAATMAQLLRATYTLDTFGDISLTEVCDGDGSGFTAEVTVCLTSGLKVSTTISHSNSTVPFHPNVCGRKIALIPKEILAASGPGSLQSVLMPPPPPPVAVKKGAEGAAAKGQPAGTAEADRQAVTTAAALTKATRFRLTSAVAYFNQHVKGTILPLRSVAQHQIDSALYLSDPQGPFGHLLGQVAAGISLACAKAAAGALNKPLAIHIGSLYQGICGREHHQHGLGAGDIEVSSAAPPSLSSTVAMKESHSINTASFAIPNLVVTVFSTEPRAMGKVRVKEVCLVVHTQNGSGPNPNANNRLSLETVSAMHRIIEAATSKAAVIAAAQCGSTPTEVEATMMPVMPDGSIKFPFFESVAQIVEVMEQSIREVTGGSGPSINVNSSANMNSPLSASVLRSASGTPQPYQSAAGTAASGPLKEFSVGLVVDGGLCYRPSGKYALINGEAEVSGAVLAEQLAALVLGSSANANGQNTTGMAAPTPNAANLQAAAPAVQQPTCGGGVLTYLEDTHIDTDIEAMQRLMHKVGGLDNVIVAGNNLYGSDATALTQGAQLMLTNHAILRLNDVGRLTTLLENARHYRNSYPGASIGITSEATEGDGAAVAHVAIGCHARTLRVGGLLRKEHAAIINELLRMSDYLESCGLLAQHAPTFDNRRLTLPSAPVEVVVMDAVAAPAKKGKK